MPDLAPHRLSKSRFIAGWQCPKLLWWKVNEPGAIELQPDIVQTDLFDQGRLVGARAQDHWPEGMLIDGEYADSARITRTAAAISQSSNVIFEACFEYDGAFCAVDVLERNASGWTLIEVKSSTSVKEDVHIPEVAFQVYVARGSGLHVTRAEVMHLNNQHRHPDSGALFVRTDVTEDVEALIPRIPAQIALQRDVLKGALPQHAVGEHCWFRGAQSECAFIKRCWPDDPDHIGNLHGVGPVKTCQWMKQGIHTMSTIPATAKLNVKQTRQLRSQRTGEIVVEKGLAEALRPAAQAARLGFLDFETVGRALPPWNGLGPWLQTAAQFSYHERDQNGQLTHAEFLAEGPSNPSLSPDDPREAIARAMIEATADADLIVMYTTFERTQIKNLAAHLPELAEPLNALAAKLWDLNPVIANHVYHPGFRGSFSLKHILTPLVPDLSYSDLVVVDGKVASVQIARLLFVSGRIPPAERDKTRHDLLEYCKRDTFATVRLVQRLAELAGSAELFS
jgi:hypothetical protein